GARTAAPKPYGEPTDVQRGSVRLERDLPDARTRQLRHRRNLRVRPPSVLDRFTHEPIALYARRLDQLHLEAIAALGVLQVLSGDAHVRPILPRPLDGLAAVRVRPRTRASYT